MHIEEDNEGSPPDRHGYMILFIALLRYFQRTILILGRHRRYLSGEFGNSPKKEKNEKFQTNRTKKRRQSTLF